MPTPPAPAYRPPPDEAPRILFLDASLLICSKPPGLLSVPGRGEAHQDCLLHRLQRRHPEALLVHRLDMETSGLLVFARSVAAQRALSISFAAREVHKRYVAVLDGLLTPDQGKVSLPLIADWPNRPRQKVDHEQGKPSLTEFRVLARDHAHATTRVALTPVTGRSHQLRVHMLALGHPILGDRLYNAPMPAQGPARLLLHAELIALPHPETGERLECSCPAAF